MLLVEYLFMLSFNITLAENWWWAWYYSTINALREAGEGDRDRWTDHYNTAWWQPWASKQNTENQLFLETELREGFMEEEVLSEHS